MNKEAFGKLVIDAQDSLYRVAKSILYSDEDCKDAISEAIIKGFEKLDTLKKDKFAKTWLTRILINECYDILRKSKNVEDIEAHTYELGYEEQDNYSELYDAIMKLEVDYRTAIVLYYIEGYKIKEIASMVDSTESAVKKRLARAREKLRLYLEGGLKDEDR